MEFASYIILLALFYFAPTLMARSGRRGSVFVVNALLGWTILGWVLALFLAIRSRENVAKRVAE